MYKRLFITIFALFCLGVFGVSTVFAAGTDTVEINVTRNSSLPAQFKIVSDISGYAFKWAEGNTFQYSWDGVTFQTPQVFLDGPQEAGYHYTDIMMNIPSGVTKTIHIRNSSTQKIYMIVQSNEATYTHTNFVGTPGGQINLYSGADYSDLRIINRQEWGANESWMSWAPQYSKIERIIVHHTAWTNNPNDYAATVREIYKFHALSRGWGDIGYHYLIDPKGNIYEGRTGGSSALGAHAGGFNAGSLGIALMGTFSNQAPTASALSALQRLIAEKSVLHDIQLEWGNTVIGHRDAPGNITSCPGQALYNMMPGIVGAAQNIVTTELAGGHIASAVAAAKLAIPTPAELRLKLTYADPDITLDQKMNLLPYYSGIMGLGIVSGDELSFDVESYNTAHTPLTDSTFDQLRWLYTVFKLDPNIENVEAVTDPTPVNFVPWTNAGGKTPVPVSAIEFNGKLFQFVKGTDSAGSVYYRSTTDGVFDSSAPAESWVKPSIGGTTVGSLGLAVFQNKLYVVAARTDSKIYTAMLDTSNNWTPWSMSTGKADAMPAMSEFTVEGQSRLYQIVKGYQNIFIYARYTTDGVFDLSAPNESWVRTTGKTVDAPSIISHQNKLFAAVKGTNDSVYLRSTVDGIFNDDDPSEAFANMGMDTLTHVSMTVFNDKLHMAVRDANSLLIRTRYQQANGSWNPDWTADGSKAEHGVNIASFQGNLIYTVARFSSYTIFSRTID